MRSLWFRLYVDLPRSRKVFALPDDVFRFWILLMCVVKEAQGNGKLPSVDDISFGLRKSPEEVLRNIETLKASKFIEAMPDGLYLHDWMELQPRGDGDPTAAERKARQRAKDAAAGQKKTVTPKSRVTSRDKSRVYKYKEEGESERGNKDEAASGASKGAQAVSLATKKAIAALFKGVKPYD
jgi:hypothetical protein